MLLEYINKAMSKAEYEKLEDRSYSGKISECEGTIAFGQTLYQCQNELRSVLEGWLIVKIRYGDPLPVIEGVDLSKGIPVLKKTVKYG
ncbi:MAG: type II toxin-antitoxin system HicB family antitoxin [Acidobacteriota bacterium]|nr:type II toxin-antitoxin system HicB family antitoxin [Acidobacteriota bacterium]